MQCSARIRQRGMLLDALGKDNVQQVVPVSVKPPIFVGRPLVLASRKIYGLSFRQAFMASPYYNNRPATAADRSLGKFFL